MLWIRREQTLFMAGGSGNGDVGEEIREEDEQIYFISTDLVVNDAGGEEDHGYGNDDGKTGLSPQGDTHLGSLTTLY
jgi:hypothetical protein